MGMMQQAAIDIMGILGNTSSGFALPIKFKAPDGTELETTGHFFNHSLQYDENGQAISGDTAVCHVSETPFMNASYPMRRLSDGVITFKDHIVTATYADGSIKIFSVYDPKPDYSINMITLQLQRYVGN